MRKYRFVCERQADSDALGWRLRSQPGFDPLGGIAVAHDILEHFPDSTDSPADELQALGAELYLRGNNGYWRQRGSCQEPARHMCASVPGVVRHMLCENIGLPPAPPCNLNGDDAKPFDHHVLKFQIAFNDYVRKEDFGGEDVSAYLDDIVGWIKAGYRRARKRYGRVDGHDLMRLFCEIEEAAEQLLKSAVPGAVMEVSVSLAKCTSKARVSFAGSMASRAEGY